MTDSDGGNTRREIAQSELPSEQDDPGSQSVSDAAEMARLRHIFT
jgi:hypothetical protein